MSTEYSRLLPLVTSRKCAPQRRRRALDSVLTAGLLALAAGALPAQGRVWIVDAANGPGAHFTSLVAAIAAAADGDQIRVRPGSYFPVTVSKGLTIVNDKTTLFSCDNITIENVPAGHDVVVKGCISSSIVKPQVQVRNCAGRVLLDRLQLSPFFGQITFGPAIAIDNCALVTLQQTQAKGHPAVRATGSTLDVVDCTLTGGDAVLTFQLQPSYPALHVTGGRVEVTNSQFVGGNGASLSPTSNVPPHPALLAGSSVLRVAGGSLVAGTGTAFAQPALQGDGGTLRIDPRVALTPYLGAPSIGGTIAVQTVDLPALSAAGAPPGGTVRVRLSARAGDAAALFVSPSADVQPFPALGGDLGLDLARTLHAVTVTLDASGQLSLNIPVRNDVTLRGRSWVWQGLAGTAAKGFLLTNSPRYVQE